MRLHILGALLSLGLSLAASGQTMVGGLARRAELGARLQAPTATRPGAVVAGVTPGGPAAQSGLRAGDLLVQLNAVPLTDAVAYSRAINELRGGVAAQLTVLRAGQRLDLRCRPAARALEKHPASTVEYGQLTTPLGHTLRTLVTKPAATGQPRRLPAILLVPWLSCASVEVTQIEDGFDQLINQLAESPTHLFMRVEKPGVGDSQGPACADCDLQTEVAGYRAALAALKRRPDVDTARLYLVGFSLGASLAPLVGAGHPIRGYLVASGCGTTWLEHMLALERRRLTLLGETPGAINAKMGSYATLYQRYYVEQSTPQAIIRQYPHLAPLWYEAPAHQYGRPAAFYHQLQALNIEAAWSAVKVPTLALYGEYDWIMSLSDHERIVQLVNANQAGLARLVVLPQASHNLLQFDTPRQAFAGTNGRQPAQLPAIVVDWFREH